MMRSDSRGSVIRVGPADSSIGDWKGVVYPSPAPRGFDPLTYLSGYFNVIEINSSFYRSPAKKTAESWVHRVAGNSSFRFTAKLFRQFTHEPAGASAEDERVFREGMKPLMDAGLLGALLIQFPWSFKNETASHSYLMELLDQFADFPLVVEVRHGTWNHQEVHAELAERGIGFCNIDQPVFRGSLRPTALVTSPVGYVRLHGRNYDEWFSERADAAERYNYLYSQEELEPWIEKIRRIAAQAPEVYVITNNHFEGKGVVNGLEIKSILESARVQVPGPLPSRYPRLADIHLETKEDELLF